MNTKQATLALFLAGASATDAGFPPLPPIPAPVTEGAELVAGLLKGALDTEGFNDIETCVKDGKAIINGAESVVADLKAGGVSNIIAAVQEVGLVLGEAQTAARDCVQSAKDIKKLEEMSAIFKHPMQLAITAIKDIKLYGTSIEKELTAAVADEKAHQWFGMGYQLGSAGALTLWGEPAQKLIKTTRMLQGAVKPFGGHFNLEALLVCVGDEDKAALTFDAAFTALKKAIKDQSPQEAIPALLLAFAGISEAKQGLPACEAIDTATWGYLSLEKSTNMLGDAQVFSVSGDELYINGRALLLLLAEAVEAYEAGDFERAGELIAKIMKLVLDEKTEDTLFLY